MSASRARLFAALLMTLRCSPAAPSDTPVVAVVEPVGIDDEEEDLDEKIAENVELELDGIHLGDLFTDVMKRPLYEAPCDSFRVGLAAFLAGDAARHLVAYGPSRHCGGRRAFPEQTTVIFLLRRTDDGETFGQPIEAIAWFGGNYFAARSNFPSSVGATLEEVRRALGPSDSELTLEADGPVLKPLVARRHPRHVHAIAQGRDVIGFVLGSLPDDGDDEQWRALVGVYQRYARQLVPSVAPCCAALVQTAASAVPQFKGAYIAAAGACNAQKGAPTPSLAAVRAVLAGLPMPAACR